MGRQDTVTDGHRAESSDPSAKVTGYTCLSVPANVDDERMSSRAPPARTGGPRTWRARIRSHSIAEVILVSFSDDFMNHTAEQTLDHEEFLSRTPVANANASMTYLSLICLVGTPPRKHSIFGPSGQKL